MPIDGGGGGGDDNKFIFFYLLRKFTRKISIYWQEQYHWQLQAVWMANWLYTREG